MPPTVLDTADTTQFFVDDSAVAAQKGVERRVHQLSKHPSSPILEQTGPRDAQYLWPVSVGYDEQCAEWRLWYCSLDASQRHTLLHYAVSKDGVCWQKPELGLFDENGSRANNITVWLDGTPVPGACVVFDEPTDPDPSRRYKLIYYLPNYYLAYSADGLTWRKAQEEPVWPNGAGDGLEETNFFMRDELVGRYRGYMRVWQRHQTIRKTSLGESDDLRHWTGPRIIWEAGPELGVGAQIYGMNVFIDGGVYWGLPWIVYTDEPLDAELRQTMRLKLAWSRDGWEWQAVAPEQDVVPMGESGAFDAGMLWSSCPVVAAGDRLRLYYCGSDVRHDNRGGRRAIGLAEIRRGRFVSLHAEDEGMILTRRLLLRGEDLRVNAKTERDGFVVAELLNDSGQVMEAFSAKTADAFVGDETDHVLSWQGQSDLTSLIGQNVMLRVRLRRADLFSFRAGGRKERFSASLTPPPVRCGRCAAPPVIDGILDDGCWQDFANSGVADEFVKFTENTPAAVKTRVLLTHDGVNLYIAVDCEEPLVEKLSDAPAGEPVNYHKEDLVEFRFSAPGQGTFFNQLMVAASGRQQHCRFSVEEGGSKALDTIEWDAATSVAGGHWYLEMAVPFRSLGTASPEPGEKWELNVIRYRYTEGKDISCWSCMFGSAHRNDRAGALVFS